MASNLSKPIVVLDASTLVYDPQATSHYTDCQICISSGAIDKLATDGDARTERAQNAREALSALVDSHSIVGLDDVARVGEINDGIAIVRQHTEPLALAERLAAANPGRQITVVTRDAATRLHAMSARIPVALHSPSGLGEHRVLGSGIHRIDRVQDVERSGPQATTKWRDTLAPNELLLPATGIEDALIVGNVDGDGVQTIRPDIALGETNAWGITGRNDEQSFALWLLTNTDIDLVSLEGDAGTGKTLLALAAGLEQTLEQRRFVEVIVTRATIAIGEDIGFLPGTEEEKMTPWMGAIEDNLEVLLPSNQSTRGATNWGRGAGRDLLGTRIRVKSINFMRGRTFVERYIVIDEAQNLTPFQVKTLLTRAGKGSKIVLLGNLGQIDTPWLDSASSGFSWAVARLRPWTGSGHVALSNVERSDLASQAVARL